MITICFTYFKSLTLANLAAALYTVRRQDMSKVAEIVIIDNDTIDSVESIQQVIDVMDFKVPVRLHSYKHGDASRTHSWSSNAAVRLAQSEWILFTRADYLLDFHLLRKMEPLIEGNRFVTSNGCHLQQTIGECEQTHWRVLGPCIFEGSVFDYTKVDAGVYLMRREAFVDVNGLNEDLTAWGHAQTHFQHKLHVAGVEFVRIPETLFWHPAHGGAKNIDVAHAQLATTGVDLKECWKRYEGVSPY